MTSHLVINEFEQNPPGDESITGGEFLELFNPTSSAVDISGWTLTTTHGSICKYTIPSGNAVGSGPSWWVVTFSAQCIDNYDPDSLILRDKGGVEIDRTPAEMDAESNTRDWQRVPDAGTDWQFRQSTKGSANAPNPVPEFSSAMLVLVVALLTSTWLRKSSKSYARKAAMAVRSSWISR
jgi:hypothetical protein